MLTWVFFSCPPVLWVSIISLCLSLFSFCSLVLSWHTLECTELAHSHMYVAETRTHTAQIRVHPSQTCCLHYICAVKRSTQLLKKYLQKKNPIMSTLPFAAAQSALDDTAHEPSSDPSLGLGLTDRVVIILSRDSLLVQMVAHNQIIGRGQQVWLCGRWDANGWCVGE